MTVMIVTAWNQPPTISLVAWKERLVASAVASKPDDAKLFELKADPRYKSAAKTFTDLEPTIEMFRIELGNQRQPQ